MFGQNRISWQQSARQFLWLSTETRLMLFIYTRTGNSRAHAVDVVEQGPTYAMPHT